MRAHLPFMFLTLLAVASAAHAQTSPGRMRLFTGAHFGPNWDDRYSASSRIPGQVPAAGFSFGLESSRAGIEVDLTAPDAWHVREEQPQRFKYAGQPFGVLQKDHVYESVSTVRRRSTEIGILYRRNFHPRDGVTISALAGGGFVWRPNESVRVTKEVLGDGALVEVERFEQQSSRNYVAGLGGVDAAFSLSRHLAVVARLRFTAFPALLDDGGSAPKLLVAHPQIGVRWTF